MKPDKTTKRMDCVDILAHRGEQSHVAMFKILDPEVPVEESNGTWQLLRNNLLCFLFTCPGCQRVQHGRQGNLISIESITLANLLDDGTLFFLCEATLSQQPRYCFFLLCQVILHVLYKCSHAHAHFGKMFSAIMSCQCRSSLEHVNQFIHSLHQFGMVRTDLGRNTCPCLNPRQVDLFLCIMVVMNNCIEVL